MSHVTYFIFADFEVYLRTPLRHRRLGQLSGLESVSILWSLDPLYCSSLGCVGSFVLIGGLPQRRRPCRLSFLQTSFFKSSHRQQLDDVGESSFVNCVQLTSSCKVIFISS